MPSALTVVRFSYVIPELSVNDNLKGPRDVIKVWYIKLKLQEGSETLTNFILKKSTNCLGGCRFISTTQEIRNYAIFRKYKEYLQFSLKQTNLEIYLIQTKLPVKWKKQKKNVRENFQLKKFQQCRFKLAVDIAHII